MLTVLGNLTFLIYILQCSYVSYMHSRMQYRYSAASVFIFKIPHKFCDNPTLVRERPIFWHHRPGCHQAMTSAVPTGDVTGKW